jgi:FkbM family methyltransferase
MIFDIGACSGLEGIHYAKVFPGSMVHAFEPVPANHIRVLQNMEQNPEVRMQAHRIALSNTEGSAVLHVSSAEGEMARHGNKSSSLLEPGMTGVVFPWLKFNEHIEVPTLTLDAFCAEHGITSIDLIHMDVQGAELMVLEGAPRMLHHISTIWMEVERVALYKHQPLKNDVERFMRDHGFERIFSTVSDVAGDQFWAHRSFVRSQPIPVRIAMLVQDRKWAVRNAFSWLKGRLRRTLNQWLRQSQGDVRDRNGA